MKGVHHIDWLEHGHDGYDIGTTAPCQGVHDKSGTVGVSQSPDVTLLGIGLRLASTGTGYKRPPELEQTLIYSSSTSPSAFLINLRTSTRQSTLKWLDPITHLSVNVQSLIMQRHGAS
jgi:hypothetical protein